MISQGHPEKNVDVLLPKRKDEQNVLNKKEGERRERLKDGREDFVHSVGLAGKSIEEIKKGKKERAVWKSQVEIHLERVATSMAKPPWSEACQQSCGPHGAWRQQQFVSGALCTWGQSALW